jgi:tRNA A-37 threonylcarbamoyl transferase component Bud32
MRMYTEINPHVPDRIVLLPDHLNAVVDNSTSFVLRKHDGVTTAGIIKGDELGMPHDLFVKRFNYRGFFDFLVHRFSNDRAKRLWERSRSLYEKGFPVPEPLIYIRASFRKRSAFYLSRVVENAESLWSLYKKGVFQEDHALVELLARTIAEWHLKGAVHGDLKWPNILVRRDENGYAFILIDLDHSRLCPVASLKGISKDLRRFYRFALEIGAEQWAESAFFPAYSDYLPDEIKMRIDLPDIKRKGMRDWIKKGRRKLP